MIGEATGQDPIPSIPSRDFAIIPDDFCGLSPKLLKKEGDHVTAGEAVFHDKNNPEILVVSPVSGIVSSIIRGARRKIEALKIEADSQQDHVKFDAEKLADIKCRSVGIWLMGFFQTAPIRNCPVARSYSARHFHINFRLFTSRSFAHLINRQQRGAF